MASNHVLHQRLEGIENAVNGLGYQGGQAVTQATKALAALGHQSSQAIGQAASIIGAAIDNLAIRLDTLNQHIDAIAKDMGDLNKRLGPPPPPPYRAPRRRPYRRRTP